MEVAPRSGNAKKPVSPKLTKKQKGKQPVVYDNRNRIAMNKNGGNDQVSMVKGSFKAKPTAKPNVNSKPGPSSVKSEKVPNLV